MGDMGELLDFCPTIAPELHDLLDFVRKHSPYYRELWRDTSEDGTALLHRYPVVNRHSFWEAHNASIAFNAGVLTGPVYSGVMVRSGGAQTNPRITTYTKDELKTISQQVGTAILAAGIRPHDRVANLLSSGLMEPAFLTHALALTDLQLPLVHLPIGGGPSTIALQLMRHCGATIVFASTSTLVDIAEHLLEQGETMPRVRVLLFSGSGADSENGNENAPEPFNEDQRNCILNAFPCARIRPLFYGNTDVGVVGYSSSAFDCRQFTVAAPYVVVEIVSGRDRNSRVSIPITENSIPGRLLVTNLGRRLQPVVRFPTGGRAEWVDFVGGRFRVLAGEGKD